MYVEHIKRNDTWKVRGVDGKRKWDEIAFDTEAKANKRIKILEKRREDNALGFYKKIKLRDAFEIFKMHRLPKLRSDLQRSHAICYINQINESLGDLTLDQITYAHISEYWESFITRGCKPSTANRSIMWIGNLYERFYTWNAMVPKMMPEKVALPEKNPVQIAKKEDLEGLTSEIPFRRTRVPTLEELRQAKDWCFEDPRKLGRTIEFWGVMIKAMRFMLRKSDLLALKPNSAVKGFQGKTGRSFDLPLMNEQAVTLGSRALRTRWDALRKALGWDKRGTPLHTTWHDLRHVGPTMIGEMGYSSKIIQSLLGHATEQQSMVYTNARAKVLTPPLEELTKALDSI